jgi:hypothetical protein
MAQNRIHLGGCSWKIEVRSLFVGWGVLERKQDTLVAPVWASISLSWPALHYGHG